MGYYYQPRLGNNLKAPISWLIRCYIFNVHWPLNANATQRMRVVDKILIVLLFIDFCIINEAEINYIIINRKDIGMALEGMATYLILIEAQLRIFDMAFKKEQIKVFLDNFYKNIYIERDDKLQMHDDIHRNMRFTQLVSFSYIGTLFSYLSIPVIGYFYGLRLFPFKMTFHYDHTPIYCYLPSLTIVLWIGVAVVSQLVVEANLLATIILHLNARYKLLQYDVQNLHATVRESSKSDILKIFRKQLIDIIRRNADLNEFASKFQAQFSFRIFFTMAFSAILLCVLSFKAVTLGLSSKNITYITWIIGKIVELLVVGQLGSTLIDTTDQLSSMYYLCNWEDVLVTSTNTQDNIRLMKIIQIAITLNEKPFYLSGLNFFNISLPTVVTIIQGAGSYFTCLYAFR